MREEAHPMSFHADIVRITSSMPMHARCDPEPRNAPAAAEDREKKSAPEAERGEAEA
jgi:hypothetical protein